MFSWRNKKTISTFGLKKIALSGAVITENTVRINKIMAVFQPVTIFRFSATAFTLNIVILTPYNSPKI